MLIRILIEDLKKICHNSDYMCCPHSYFIWHFEHLKHIKLLKVLVLYRPKIWIDFKHILIIFTSLRDHNFSKWTMDIFKYYISMPVPVPLKVTISKLSTFKICNTLGPRGSSNYYFSPN